MRHEVLTRVLAHAVAAWATGKRGGRERREKIRRGRQRGGLEEERGINVLVLRHKSVLAHALAHAMATEEG